MKALVILLFSLSYLLAVSQKARPCAYCSRFISTPRSRSKTGSASSSSRYRRMASTNGDAARASVVVRRRGG